jgi:hypothetical protein
MVNRPPPPQWPPLRPYPWYQLLWRRSQRAWWKWRRVAMILVVVGGVAYLVIARHLVSNLPSLVEMPTLVEGVYSGNPLWRRPVSAPNGKPWPRVSGYLEGYAQSNVGGIAAVVVDNSGGRNDLYGKLIDRDQETLKAVRVFFLKAHESMTLKGVVPGRYDVRYLNLDSGRILQAPVIHVTVKRTEDGEHFMGWTVPVYSTVKGKIQHREISRREF